MTTRHSRADHVAAFRDRECRQVWAIHRRTGQPIYLPVGQADAMRELAKRELRCPVPGCEAPISTRGGSRRDHFFHLAPPDDGHAGGGEGLMHLQAKAMLAAWVRAQGLEAAAEQTVKDRALGIDRRADVMATWPDGRQVALEVEYKSFDPRAWRAKHDEYAAAHIVCVWLFGHLPRYLATPPTPPAWPAERAWDRLQWRELTRTVAQADLPVLFVNPVECAVATVVQDGVALDQARKTPRWWQRPNAVGLRLATGADWVEARIVVDDLADCTLDPERGLITPTMLAVNKACVGVAAAAAQDKAADEARDRRRAEREAAEAQRAAARTVARAGETDEQRAQRADWLKSQREREKLAWKTSAVRARLIERLGTVPAYITLQLRNDRGVHAHHAHWHAQLLADLTAEPDRPSTIGTTVTLPAIYALITRHWHISDIAAVRSRAINDYLRHLDDVGYLEYLPGHVRLLADLNHPPNSSRAPEPVAVPQLAELEERWACDDADDLSGAKATPRART